MERILITKEGYQALKDEHRNLIKVERTNIINAIETARAHGDLKENAEYHAAKEKQGFIEGRIQRINHLLAHCEAVDVSSIKDKKITFGATVTYEDMETEKETTWMLVGEDEQNIKAGMISVQSPIAKALLGKSAGDEVVIRVPRGDMEVEITSIVYKSPVFPPPNYPTK